MDDSLVERNPSSHLPRDAVDAGDPRRVIRPPPLRNPGQFKTRKVLTVRGAADLMSRLQSYRAGSGDILELEAGTYHVSLVLTHSDLILRAAPNAEVVLSSDRAVTVEINAEYLCLENLCIEGKNGNFPAVLVSKGSPDIVKCSISGAGGGVLVARGDPTFTDCEIHSCRRAPGIHFLNASGRVEGCRVHGNTDAGIAVERSGANPWISDCQITNGRGCGAAFLNFSRGVLRDSIIAENACSGVFVEASAQPMIVGCTLTRNKAPGLTVQAKGRGHCEECVFEGNADHEVLVTTGGDPVIRHNEFRDGANSGILVSDNGLGTIESNTFTNFQVAAISICTGADPVVSENTISFGPDCNMSSSTGIVVRDQGRGQIRKNLIQGWNREDATAQSSSKTPTQNSPGKVSAGHKKVPISVVGGQPQISGNSVGKRAAKR